MASTLYLDLGIQNARIPPRRRTWRFEPSLNGWPFPILRSLHLAAPSSCSQLAAPSSQLPWELQSPRHTVRHEEAWDCAVGGTQLASITRLGGAVDDAYSGATTWLCMHAASICCAIVARCARAGAALSSAAPVSALPFPGASVSAYSCPPTF